MVPAEHTAHIAFFRAVVQLCSTLVFPQRDHTPTAMSPRTCLSLLRDPVMSHYSRNLRGTLPSPRTGYFSDWPIVLRSFMIELFVYTQYILFPEFLGIKATGRPRYNQLVFLFFRLPSPYNRLPLALLHFGHVTSTFPIVWGKAQSRRSRVGWRSL